MKIDTLEIGTLITHKNMHAVCFEVCSIQKLPDGWYFWGAWRHQNKEAGYPEMALDSITVKNESIDNWRKLGGLYDYT